MIMTETQSLAFLTQKLHRLTAAIEADTRRLKAGYDPNQARVPAGQRTGGRWTSFGGRGGGMPAPGNPFLQRIMVRKPPYEESPGDPFEQMLESGGTAAPRAYYPPPEEPLPAPVQNAVRQIGRLNRSGAEDLHEVLTERAYGRLSPKEANPDIRASADHVEEFLGGKIEPQDIKPSKSGDLVILKGDKKFRMDVKNPGLTRDRKSVDDPHFHFEVKNDSGKWVDASDGHKNYFNKD